MYNFNYTNRVKLSRSDVGIESFIEKDKVYFKIYSLDFDDYDLPNNSIIKLEAYRQNKMMSFSLGTIANKVLVPLDNELKEFHDVDEILFRVKIVAENNSALLLARVDGVRAKKSNNEDDGQGESLLPIISDDIGSEVWKLEFDNGPRLLINSNLRKEEIASDPLFQSLVMPQIMNQVLYYLFFVEGTSFDKDFSDGTWQDLWYLSAINLISGKEPPAATTQDRTEVLNWIDEVVSSFASNQQSFSKYKGV